MPNARKAINSATNNVNRFISISAGSDQMLTFSFDKYFCGAVEVSWTGIAPTVSLDTVLLASHFCFAVQKDRSIERWNAHQTMSFKKTFYNSLQTWKQLVRHSTGASIDERQRYLCRHSNAIEFTWNIPF